MKIKLNVKTIHGVIVNADNTVTPLNPVSTTRIVKADDTAKKILIDKLDIPARGVVVTDVVSKGQYFEIDEEIVFQYGTPCDPPRKSRKDVDGNN